MTNKLNFKYKLSCKPTSVVVNEDGTVDLEFNSEQERDWLVLDGAEKADPELVGETQSDLLWEQFYHDVSLTDEDGNVVEIGE